MRKIKKKLTAFLGMIGIIIAQSVFAAAGSLEDLSNSLMGPVSGLAHLLHAISFVAGTGFLLGGLMQYKYHRENPQQVRISTPLLLVALGIVLVAIPLISMWSGSAKLIR